MKRLILVVIVVLALAAPVALAQSCPTVPMGSSGRSSHERNVWEDGRVHSIDRERGLVVIRTTTDELIQFGVDSKKTRVKADKKTGLVSKDKKKLDVQDVEEGQMIRIFYKPSAPEIAAELKIMERSVVSVAKSGS